MLGKIILWANEKESGRKPGGNFEIDSYLNGITSETKKEESCHIFKNFSAVNENLIGDKHQTYIQIQVWI